MNDISIRLNLLRLNKDYTTTFQNPDKTLFKNDLQDLILEILKTEKISLKVIFKKIWKERKMSLLHLSKYKEENTNEFYQVLFKEVQLFLFPDDEFNLISKIFSIYCLYTLYNTQTYDIKFQITVIPETLIEINKLLKEVKEISKSLFSEIYSMINQLYSSHALKIGCIIGLKTIILNKYLLPIELKCNIYNEYKQMFETKETLDLIDHKKTMELNNIKSSLNDYKHNKQNLVNEIKNLFTSTDQDSLLYCEEVNKIKNFNKSSKKEFFNMNNKNYNLFDLSKESITKLDINMDQFDDECLNN